MQVDSGVWARELSLLQIEAAGGCFNGSDSERATARRLASG